MKRIVWLTDLHLNFIKFHEVESFLGQLAAALPDAVLISGDTAESSDLFMYLRQMARAIQVPIYFVLGNHDYYFNSIARVRDDVRKLCREVPDLIWLSEANPIEFTPHVGLVGHDGWADGRAGDFARSMVQMYDYQLIQELTGLNKETRWVRLKEFGDEAAAHLRRVLPAALERYQRVFVVTHVPPWREACWYQGQTSNDEWLPHFTCIAMGQAIESVACEYPDREITVLCGHTHSPGTAHPRSNITVFTGGAEYCSPEIQKIFELD